MWKGVAEKKHLYFLYFYNTLFLKPPSTFVKKWSVFEKLAYKYGDRGGGTYLWV